MVQVKEKTKRSRFTLDLTPELRVRLKIAAVRKGITMREYSISAIEERLNRDELRVVIPGKFTRQSLERARESKKALFGDRRLTESSADIIRQLREERAKQLD